MSEPFKIAKRYPPFDPRLAVVCFDFDGVLASAKWPKPEIGEPDPDAKEAIEHYASRGCEVVVCSARPASHHPRIWRWLDEQGLSWAVYDVTNVKPVACLYFDDRAVRWPLA